MILVALGANLDSPVHGPPRATLEAALSRLDEHGVILVRRSRWFKSAPVPISDDPWFVNGVAHVETLMDPHELMRVLHDVEAEFGRVRTVPNAPRILDLDLLDFRGLCLDGPALQLPHPRMVGRAFVLLPLRDVAPRWVDPRSARDINALIEDLPSDVHTEPMLDVHPRPEA